VLYYGSKHWPSRHLRAKLLRDRVAVVGGLLVLTTLFVAGCAHDAPPATKPTPEVTVAKPVVDQVTDYFEFPGCTEAVSEVEIRARVTGYVVKVNFEDGQEVKACQELFEIDPRPYRAALDRARGDLARLEAARDKAEAALARSERLRLAGAESDEEYEQNVANVKEVKAGIESAKAAITQAALELEFTKIISPIDGRVSKARIKEGNLIQSGGASSALLTTVVTTDPIYVCFNLDELALLRYQELARKLGQDLRPSRLKDLKLPVEIGLGNEEDFPHVGVLDFTDNKIDRTTGTLHVRAVFENTGEYLTPGLFVRVRIPFGSPHKALLVSERAIGRDQRQKFVLVVNSNNVVEYRRVAVGPLRNGMRVIESGIEADDRIVVKGVQRARPGTTVQPHTEETVASASASPPTAASVVAPTTVEKSDQARSDRAKTN
jgi:RND family efflux transporter MFP subunit